MELLFSLYLLIFYLKQLERDKTIQRERIKNKWQKSTIQGDNKYPHKGQYMRALVASQSICSAIGCLRYPREEASYEWKRIKSKWQKSTIQGGDKYLKKGSI